jgi:hypothetical protein
MERVLEIHGLGEIIFKELSMNDLANLRVTKSLRKRVSHHVGTLMDSYGKSLAKCCDRIMAAHQDQDNQDQDQEEDQDNQDQWDPGSSIYTTPYNCIYNYYHTVVKLSFLCPAKQVLLNEIIARLQKQKRLTFGYEYILVDGHYRSKGFSVSDKSLYEIVSYLHLNTYGKIIRKSAIEHLENKLLPLV